MPADFTPASIFIWPPPENADISPPTATPRQRRKPGPKPLPRNHPARRKRRGPLSEAQRIILSDRIEAAIADGRLPPLLLTMWGETLFKVLFPEDYAGPAHPAANPATTAPGSPERGRDYQRRVKRRESLWHPRDPIDSARVAMVGQMLANGRGRVTGWAEGEDGGPDEERDDWYSG